jgi:hypothetical protein
MALMPFTELTAGDKKTLLDVAQKSIQHGLIHNAALPVELTAYNRLLNEPGASFVTLNLNHQLRGCIGSLEAFQPLVKDVAEHAFAAAFRDPRFSPVSSAEIEHLEIHISVLTKSTTIDFTDEKDLLNKLEAGVDGLILQEGFHKATFLPAVWEQLPEPKDFLTHLKLKAGLDKNYWSENIIASRYKTISF